MKKWYDGRLNGRAREMRKYMTEAESKLWNYLRKRPEHFYRQRAIGPFIADFYSPRLKLAIEADGIQHETADGRAYDTERGALFEKFGVQIPAVQQPGDFGGFSGRPYPDRRSDAKL